MHRTGQPSLPSRLSVAATMALLSMWVTATAVAASWYPHQLPWAYRTRLLDASVAKTVAACVAVLERDGYKVAMADSAAGVIFTRSKVMEPEDPEIGGQWQIMCSMDIRAVRNKSLVSVELLAESPGTNRSAPISFDLQQSQKLYENLFGLIRAELNEGASAP